MRPARVLLVQMPFFRLESPSLGLELLHAALRREGIESQVAYLNLDFGRRIGKDAYTWISVRAPRYLLLGDLVFGPSLHGEEIGVERVEALVSGLGKRRESGVPAWLVARFPSLVQAAKDFLAEQCEAIEWSRYDLVGIGTLFHAVPALALARMIKEQPGAPKIILGGSHCEGEMGDGLHRAFPFVDFVCRGEGEELIVQLARHLQDGRRPLETIRGLLWRHGGETRGVASGRATIGSDPGTGREAVGRQYQLDRLPVPRYDAWLERVRSLAMHVPAELRLPIETSRGCWYGEKRQCTFCGFNGEAMAFRRKSPGRILEEFRALMSHEVRFLQCVDNIPDPLSFRTLLPKLATLNGGCQIFCEVMPHLNHAQVRQLHDSGIFWVQAGIESLSTRLLRMMGKGTTAFQNVRFLRYAAQWGIGASWSLLFGFPGEDPEDYREIQGLIPALAHLQPPFDDHQQIRVDRFSPIFRERQGIRNVVPAPSYQEAFRLDPETLTRLAYYFEYEYADPHDPYDTVQGCAVEMERWRRAAATAALVSFESGPLLHVLDTRPISIERHAVLGGRAREILRATEHGASLAELGARTGAPAGEIEALLAPLLERRWVVHLDDRYLSLAVPVDSWIPRGVPPLLARDAIVSEYCRRMVRLRDGFYAEEDESRRPKDRQGLEAHGRRPERAVSHEAAT